jgi:hypothetical protein
MISQSSHEVKRWTEKTAISRSRLWAANSNSSPQVELPLPPTSHSALSSEPTQSKPNRTARPSWQDDIKKRGGEEEEGAEPKESARSTSLSPPPDRISEAAGDRRNRAPRHGIPTHPGQRTPLWAGAAGSRSKPGVSRNPSPSSVRRPARPAPSTNTHSRSTQARAARPGCSPAPLSANPNVKPATLVPPASAGVGGAGRRPRLAPSRTERTTGTE